MIFESNKMESVKKIKQITEAREFLLPTVLNHFKPLPSDFKG